MKRAVVLATVALLAMLILAPMALAQGTTFFDSASPTAPSSSCSGCTGLGSSGGPAILLPAAALLLGSGILTYAILRRR